MRDGTWAAIFGNGYDSVNGKAKLFILNLQTGAVLKEFAVDTSGNNGLSQPNFILNANREVINIYAGDLKGKLWKFDVSDTDPVNWNVAFAGTPLFSAVNAAGKAQPITVMPEITSHTSGCVRSFIATATCITRLPVVVTTLTSESSSKA